MEIVALHNYLKKTFFLFLGSYVFPRYEIVVENVGNTLWTKKNNP